SSRRSCSISWSAGWAAAGHGATVATTSRPVPMSARMDASVSWGATGRPTGLSAGADYDESAERLGEAGRSAGIGEAGDRIGVALGGTRRARRGDQRDEVAARSVGQGNVAAQEVEARQDVLFVVEPGAGGLVQVAGLAGLEGQRDRRERQHQRERDDAQRADPTAPHDWTVVVHGSARGRKV